jgi:ribose-phosphate pyrophosphokinase
VKVIAYCTHAVLSGEAVARVAGPALDSLVVSDTIPLSQAAQDLAKTGKIRQISSAQLIAETMQRISNEDSVSSLFTE